MRNLKFEPSNLLRLISDELNLSGVQPVGLSNIVLVGFEPESVWFRILVTELAQSDFGLLPIVCEIPITRN